MSDLDWSIIIDEGTGEVISKEYLSVLNGKKADKQPFNPAKMTSKKDLIDHFKNELYHKTYWTNWAMAFIGKHFPEKIPHIVALSELIISRTYIFESTQTLADELSVQKKNLNKTLNKLVDIKMIRILEHSGGKDKIFIQMNPLYVWKGYVHNEVKDLEDGVHYGNNYRFSSVHKTACNDWINGQILTSSQNGSTLEPKS